MAVFQPSAELSRRLESGRFGATLEALAGGAVQAARERRRNNASLEAAEERFEGERIDSLQAILQRRLAAIRRLYGTPAGAASSGGGSAGSSASGGTGPGGLSTTPFTPFTRDRGSRGGFRQVR